MTGILFGTGIGPGDPELMTLKAVRLIRENDTFRQCRNWQKKSSLLFQCR